MPAQADAARLPGLKGRNSMRLLTVKETATMLRVSQQYVYRLTRAGELPSVHLGRGVRIEQSALEAWVAARSNPTRTGIRIT
jgi:excisionase family DNA binding protein